MALHDGMMVLRQANSETGLHPSDLLVEFRMCGTLSSGIGACLTSFENGQVVAVSAFRSATSAAGATSEAYSCNLTVTSGNLTIYSNNATSAAADVKVMIIGRPKI